MSKYTAAHEHPVGPGDARPTALQVVQDEGLVSGWSDKVVLLTGASNGIGVETARALYATGAHLYLPVRDVAKGEAVAADIRRSHPDSKGVIDVLHLDLDSLHSVRQCAEAVLSRTKTLNVLICNAGVMATPEGRTADGFETQFGTNHLAHFLLFELLKPVLLESSTPQFNSRVVVVSSAGHQRGGIQFDDYDLSKRGYDQWIAYGQSKTANIYMANEIDRRYGKDGLHATSVMPGGIWSGLQKHVEDQMLKYKADPAAQAFVKSPEQGAATTVWAAVAKEWEGTGGKYVEDCGVAKPQAESKGFMGGYGPHAYDVDAAKRLWAESLHLVGLPAVEQDS